MSTWQAVIGLEMHARLATRSKLFCACANRAGAAPNTFTCPVCAGLPGGMPRLNAVALEYGVRLATAIGADIATWCRFDRKNYFYPDLPKGYQITQFDRPLSQGGRLDIFWDGQEAQVPVQRIHLEEDAGKSVHPPGMTCSLVDLNRAGTPLLEVVTEPALHEAAAVVACVRALQQLLRVLRIGDGDLEKGSLRCDVNVSVHRRDEPVSRQRVEIKNLNSFRAIRDVVQVETQRQVREVQAGRPVRQETRLWDAVNRVTRPMRGKEEAATYGYVPENDLGRVRMESLWVQSVRRALPELPVARRRRWLQDALSAEQVAQLVDDPALGDFFDAARKHCRSSRQLANWLCNEVSGILQENGLALANSNLTPRALAELVTLRDAGRLSRPRAKQVLHLLSLAGGEAQRLAQEHGWLDESDEEDERRLVQHVVAAHPDVVRRYRMGRHAVLQFLVGQVMQASHGRSDPARVQQLLLHILAEL